MPSLMLDRLRRQRADLTKTIEDLDALAAEENRDLTDADMSVIEDAAGQIEQIDKRIEPLEAVEARVAAHQQAASQITPTAPAKNRDGGRAPLTAEPRQVKYSTAGEFLVDLVRAIPGVQDASGPVFDRHVADRVAAALGVPAEQAIARAVTGTHETTADVPGILPTTIVGQIFNDIDGARPLIGLVGAQDLTGIPGSTFNRPRITAHPNTGDGVQPEEKDQGVAGQVTMAAVPFAKTSFLRWMNVAMQVIDWTAPGTWNVLLSEMQNAYAEDTEAHAEGVLAAAVTQKQSVATDDYEGWIAALYSAKTKITTAGGTRRASALRLPDVILTSVDMDEHIGALIEIQLASHMNGIGSSDLRNFGGMLLRTDRVMLPDLPDGTVILGARKGFEFWEQRKGFLQAIEPKVLGVEIAYGGYGAAGALDASLFASLSLPTVP